MNTGLSLALYASSRSNAECSVDQEAIVQQVIAALGTPVFGTVDAKNNITLTGVLADGTYTIKYEDADGNVTEIGTLAANAQPVSNMIKQSINADGTPYNGGQGWKTGYRLNSSGAETEQTGMEVTGYMPFSVGDTVCLSEITMIAGDAAPKFSHQYIALYDSSFTFITNTRLSDAMMASTRTTIVLDAANNLESIKLDSDLFVYCGKNGITAGTQCYFRISAEEINDDSVITINESA